MMKFRKALAYFATLGAVAFAALLVLPQVTALGQERAPLEIQRDDSPIDRSNQTIFTSYAEMLEQVTPAVVAIQTMDELEEDPQGDRMREFFERFYGRRPDMPSPRERQGIGSGFIVSPNGYILTNNHVITMDGDDAVDEVVVQLEDGREFEAEIVGRDPFTDVAVLKIDGSELPFVTLGNSADLQVGDVVFAAGNPLNVGLTVTQGIVSGLERTDLNILSRRNRDARQVAVESFIQTDAAINMGNSGGALIDAQGRVVGINTAILSGTGGSIGIGFAIPINLAVDIMENLIEGESIRRGFIGVELQPLTRELAQSFELGNTKGALIANVTEGLPGAKAGLRHNDVVTEVSGVQVDSVNDMIYLISRRQPGETVDLTVVRDGEAKVVPVTLGDREKLAGSIDPRDPRLSTPQPDPNEMLLEGVIVKPVDEVSAGEYNLPPTLEGLMVTEVKEDSPNADKFVEGMVILEIDRKPVQTIEAAKRALKPGINPLYVYVNGRFAYITVLNKS